MALSCIISEFRDKARYWPKIVIFSYPAPPAFDAPVKGVPVREWPYRLLWKKLRCTMLRLSDDEESLTICLVVSIEYRRVTDGYIASRGKCTIMVSNSDLSWCRATDHYAATRWLVHWPLTGGLLHLVQRGWDWAGPQPAHAPPSCTKCTSLYQI